MKEKILAIARDEYLEKGEKGLSMRNIAKQIGVTPMAIYRYFDDKDDLQKQLLMSAFELFGTYLHASLEGKTALDRLNLCVDAFLKFALEQTKYFELMFLSVNPLNSLKAQKVIKQKSVPTFRFLQDRVRDCIEEGVFLSEKSNLEKSYSGKNDTGESEDIALSLLAHCTGLVALHISGSFGWQKEEFKEKYQASLEQMIRGLISD